MKEILKGQRPGNDPVLWYHAYYGVHSVYMWTHVKVDEAITCVEARVSLVYDTTRTNDTSGALFSSLLNIYKT